MPPQGGGGIKVTPLDPTLYSPHSLYWSYNKIEFQQHLDFNGLKASPTESNGMYVIRKMFVSRHH